ncbi:hypothetical protein CRENPOLYSF1_200019 [Crenothrix polyspora]|uniref:Uncharacterized protein n=1 Tax=Crenothrix polyspora TaxID=360316 RepID=A0A1R4H6I1_9GAMM|nr:hypothetical protein CRENPOLYSF1_200019 [Crenothrix polyspora]
MHSFKSADQGLQRLRWLFLSTPQESAVVVLQSTDFNHALIILKTDWSNGYVRFYVAYFFCNFGDEPKGSS